MSKIVNMVDAFIEILEFGQDIGQDLYDDSDEIVNHYQSISEGNNEQDHCYMIRGASGNIRNRWE